MLLCVRESVYIVCLAGNELAPSLSVGGDGVILHVPIGTLGTVDMRRMTDVSMGKVVAIDVNPLTKELVFAMVMPSGLVKVCLTTGPSDGQFQ